MDGFYHSTIQGRSPAAAAKYVTSLEQSKLVF